MHEDRFLVKPTPVGHQETIRLLTQIASDYQMLSSERGIEIHVDVESFSALRTKPIQADAELLVVAVSNLVDNAIKYSYARTSVEIVGGLESDDRFSLSVTNRGVPLKAEEAEMWTRRGWRSEAARAVTGEGSGIGLWITREIMHALHGELTIDPTDATGRTRAVLLLGLAKQEGRGQ